MNKMEASRLVASGFLSEVFTHETLGTFDITALRELLSVLLKHERTKDKIVVRCCKFADCRMVDGIKQDAIAYMFANREIDELRAVMLTDVQLMEPIIFLDCPEGLNGDERSQLLVDGIHRLYERHRRGMEDFWYYLLPMEIAPRPDMNQAINVPWGDKEVVPGVGLVARR